MDNETEINSGLKLIAKSSAIMFIGIFLSKVLTYLYRIIIARNYSPEIYGLFSLSIMIAGWFVVFKRETLEKVGLYDERFGPGGGEDYDYVHRIYCAGGRASATMRSFLWHYWSVSREGAHTRGDIVPYGRKTFADTNSLFVYDLDGANSPIFPPRDNEKYGNKRKRINPGIFIEDPR